MAVARFITGIHPFLIASLRAGSRKIVSARFPHKCGEQNSRMQGFSMIELSIVLLIIAILAGSALTVGLNRMQNSKATLTESRMQRIEQALASFYIQNGRLPRPANLTRSLDNPADIATYGAEDGGLTGTALMGAVPVRTLGLGNEFMLDGWNRKITYAVDSALVAAAPAFRNAEGGRITIRDGGGASIAPIAPCPRNPLTGAVLANCGAIYTLISHGSDGGRAYLRNGTLYTPTGSVAVDVDEQENSDYGSPPADAIFVQKQPTSTFDDIVVFATKPQFIKIMGGILDMETCRKAENIIANYNGTPEMGPQGCQYITNTNLSIICQDKMRNMARAVLHMCGVNP